MINAAGDTAHAMSDETELEEGEMEEDIRPATPSPVQAVSTVVAGGVQCREDARPDKPAPSQHRSPPAAAGIEGQWPAGTSSGVSAAPRSRQTGNGRQPPTAPRALREAQGNAPRNGPTTPSDPRNAHPVVGSAHAQRGDDDSRNDRRRDRPDSPSADARPAKRHKKDKLPPQLIVTSARDLEYGRMAYLVEERQKRIDQLLWQLAESRAELHIYKTRGLNHDDLGNRELHERITKKYLKIIDTEGTKNNWRVQELSDISDEDSPRFAATRPSRGAHHDHLRAKSLPRASTPLEGEPRDAIATDDDIIHTVGEPLVQAPSCFEDGNADVGAALADSDMIAGREATDKLRDLSTAELRTQTAQVQYGLKFSYTLLLWQEPGSWLPAPLGRFGQPFWKGSSWEDFDPRRLFDKSRSDYVSLESRAFIDLARDASRIAFFHRSATQRQVVSTALQHSIGPTSHEPDMLELCRTNPGRLPIAIRRQYRHSPTGGTFYTEYDAADIGCHIFVTLSGPQKSHDGHPLCDFREQKRAWLQLIETFVLDWLPTFNEHMPEPEEMAEAVRPWPMTIDLVNTKMTRDDLFSGIWRHLTTNGMPRPSMLAGGDLHEYMRSVRVTESERKQLSEEYDEKMGGKEGVNQETKRRWVADRLSYEPVRSGFPVVRVKLSREKLHELAMRYTKLGHRKKFLPVY